jgi:uncharacterized protein
MPLTEALGSLLTGLIGGAVSGFLGVSSGGLLVPLLIFILGRDQHAAQGLSLVAQIFPTSLSGVRHYAKHGHEVAWRWLAWLAAGFAGGGVLGALLAVHVSDQLLRWSFVGYLVVLMTLMVMGGRHKEQPGTASISFDRPVGGFVLGLIGAAGGASSGFLGIGGGLAITALMAAGLKLQQHRAQAYSLAVTALPLTLPAAFVYLRQGWDIPWTVVAGVVVGLWIGTLIGSQFANRLAEATLRRLSFGCIGAMTLYMAFRALAS